MGAAGRDFHNFNVAFRADPAVEVVAFTAGQIPLMAGRRYPPDLAGPLYPSGLPIVPEADLPSLLKELGVEEVIFAYSDVSHEEVMHAASLALAAGADFRLMGTKSTMLTSAVPVISVCATRTGAGKSQTTRRVARALTDAGVKAAIVRHPMPYGDLLQQAMRRFAEWADLEGCTIEEREEYEPHLREGRIVLSGVDYARILEAAEQEADVIVWDGGNNDLPFFRPDLHIVVADPLRPGHEVRYHPGEANLRAADVIVVNKIDSATPGQVEEVEANIAKINPDAVVIHAVSKIRVDEPGMISGRRVLVVEDGPTLTHGGLRWGAGLLAAQSYGAREIVDPRGFATGSIKELYERYDLGPVLPAVGYTAAQISELQETIAASEAEVIVASTPADLASLMPLRQPTVRVEYELEERGRPTIGEVLEPIVSKVRGASET
ncbi:MAG: cyclic 2,3-diphosphoglycerate synthase [Actinomycetota bacterium]|nr:cyclic 2,3-diphosphoglycerate synthase [Actinomycetota bacterium]